MVELAAKSVKINLTMDELIWLVEVLDGLGENKDLTEEENQHFMNAYDKLKFKLEAIYEGETK